MNIISNDDFVDFLANQNLVKKGKQRKFTLHETTLANLHLSWFCISAYSFIGCEFNNCKFEDFEFNGVLFKDCLFKNCSFCDVQFMDCSIEGCQFDTPFSNSLYFGMSGLQKVKFANIELQYTWFSDCSLDMVEFKNGSFHVGRFESGDLTYLFKTKISFEKILLSDILFVDVDLTSSKISECEISLGFVRSKLSADTLESNTSQAISSIDFYSILQSEIFRKDVLADCFGIITPNIKEIVTNAVSNPKFHTVFISYSFKDGWLAKEIKCLLDKNNVKSFLWEGDAPGGKKLKGIMRDSVRDYDKFLFIASADSLKSPACQFEISEARKKYYRTWTNVFVPIHIDNYLFEVNKEDIPKKFRKEYWDNISELREVNSIDFVLAKDNDIEGDEHLGRLLEAIRVTTINI